jgi:hypothetical protein
MRPCPQPTVLRRKLSHNDAMPPRLRRTPRPLARVRTTILISKVHRVQRRQSSRGQARHPPQMRPSARQRFWGMKASTGGAMPLRLRRVPRASEHGPRPARTLDLAPLRSCLHHRRHRPLRPHRVPRHQKQATFGWTDITPGRAANGAGSTAAGSVRRGTVQGGSRAVTTVRTSAGPKAAGMEPMVSVPPRPFRPSDRLPGNERLHIFLPADSCPLL